MYWYSIGLLCIQLLFVGKILDCCVLVQFWIVVYSVAVYLYSIGLCAFLRMRAAE